MSPDLQAILATSITSLLGLTGGFLLLWRRDWVKSFSAYFVSFAAGTLLGAAFLDLIVEAVIENPLVPEDVFGWVVAGFVGFFILEKALLWHHHGHAHGEHSHATVPQLLLVGDALHNFLDGMIIAATFLVDPALGVVTAVAVFFHELPQELGDFSVMIHAGFSRAKVALWNLLGALASPIGAVLTILLAERVENLELPLLGIAAGSFIYIAAADLVPEIHREKHTPKMLLQVALLIAGILVIYAVGELFPHGA